MRLRLYVKKFFEPTTYNVLKPWSCIFKTYNHPLNQQHIMYWNKVNAEQEDKISFEPTTYNVLKLGCYINENEAKTLNQQHIMYWNIQSLWNKLSCSNLNQQHIMYWNISSFKDIKSFQQIWLDRAETALLKVNTEREDNNKREIIKMKMRQKQL